MIERNDLKDLEDTINAYVLGQISAVDLGLNSEQVRIINTYFYKVDIEQLAEDEYDAIVKEIVDEIFDL